jgi:hypothetical protein
MALDSPSVSRHPHYLCFRENRDTTLCKTPTDVWSARRGTSTWQQTTLTTNTHAPIVIRTRNTRMQAGAISRLRWRSDLGRPNSRLCLSQIYVYSKNLKCYFSANFSKRWTNVTSVRTRILPLDITFHHSASISDLQTLRNARKICQESRSARDLNRASNVCKSNRNTKLNVPDHTHFRSCLN